MRAAYKPTAKFKTFLFRVATNHCLNEVRRGEYHVDHTSTSEEAEDDAGLELAGGEGDRPDQALAGRELERAVGEALRGMSERERAAFTMCRFEGMAYRDIAEALEASEAGGQESHPPGHARGGAEDRGAAGGPRARKEQGMSCPFEEELSAVCRRGAAARAARRGGGPRARVRGVPGGGGAPAAHHDGPRRDAPARALPRHAAARCWPGSTRLPPTARERWRAFWRPGVLVPAAGLAAVAGLALWAALPHEPALEVSDAATLELAMNLEEVEDYDVVGLEDAEDLEVVAHLQELEVQ